MVEGGQKVVEGGQKVVEGGRKVVLVPQNCFYWGAAAPQTPRSSWGASSPPDPLAGGLQPPVPPAYREAPPLGLSVFFLVPRSWKPLTCGYVAAGLFPRKDGPQISGSP